ncbi:Uncharacterized protein ABJ98_2315 [Pseudomonas syringae pv. aceris]|nr:Uncharacterized protein ABJ98_2315 [Pseudomonas syringae pv. aceris]
MGCAIDRAKPDTVIDDHIRRLDAVRGLLMAKRVMTVDEFRRSVEAFSPDDYREMDYFDRWLNSLCMLVIEKDLVSEGDLDV